MFDALKARIIGKIPPKEYIAARQRFLGCLSIQADRAMEIATAGFIADFRLETLAGDAKFFSARESQILNVTAQALSGLDIKIGPGRIEVLTPSKLG